MQSPHSVSKGLGSDFPPHFEEAVGAVPAGAWGDAENARYNVPRSSTNHVPAANQTACRQVWVSLQSGWVNLDELFNLSVLISLSHKIGLQL